MLTLKLLREQPEFVIERLAVKNFDAAEIVAKILDADAQRRAAQTQLDSVLAEQNAKEYADGLVKDAVDAAAEVNGENGSEVPAETL